jgi:hypothetical protein
MLRAFIKYITARLQCFRVLVKLDSVTYAAICCLPREAIMCRRERGFNDIFRLHTEAFSCGRCAFLIPWTTGVNSFLGVHESSHRDTHAYLRVPHGDTMVARER